MKIPQIKFQFRDAVFLSGLLLCMTSCSKDDAATSVPIEEEPTPIIETFPGRPTPIIIHRCPDGTIVPIGI
ncbi:hypothetical protein [Flavobacterium sp. 3HN19-14]|uniref:hypothetical protein n=1 Tax=Flavobacterium sp. 3HN19-14 TaxID=3448133 RepID=UPI003EDED8C3